MYHKTQYSIGYGLYINCIHSTVMKYRNNSTVYINDASVG